MRYLSGYFAIATCLGVVHAPVTPSGVFTLVYMVLKIYIVKDVTSSPRCRGPNQIAPSDCGLLIPLLRNLTHPIVNSTPLGIDHILDTRAIPESRVNTL